MSKICVFVKRRSTIGKDHKHTLSQSKTPGHRSQSRPVIGKHCCLTTVEGERRAEPWNAYGGRGTFSLHRETSLFLSFIFLDGRVFSHGFWKCWVGWETDSRCRVKLGKRGIHEQNNLVFLKGNMQWQTTHRFWCCWCHRLLKGSPAVAAIWVMVYGSLPTKNWSNVVTLAVMVAESCLVHGVEFMGKTDQAGWWRGLFGWFTQKLQKYDNKRCCVSDLHLINNGAVWVGR